MIIYVCGPYRASSDKEVKRNIYKAVAAAKAIAKRGHTVICPHTNFLHLRGFPDEVIMAHCLEVVDKVHAIFLMPGWGKSEGSCQELHRANERQILVFEHLWQIPWAEGYYEGKL